MRYVFVVAVAMVILVAPAHSQMKMQDNSKDPLTLKYEREDNERKENERAYNETMKRLKGQPPAAAKNDPWSKVRPATDSTAKR